MTRFITWLKKIGPISLLFLLGFWVLSFFVLFRIFTREYNSGALDYIYTFLFLLPLMAVVALNYILIKSLLTQKRYLLYSISLPVVILIGLVIHFIVFNYLAELLFPRYYFVSTLSFWDLAQYFLVYIVVSLLLYLSKNWFELREKQAILERENKEVQLKNLKAQLNPHFLFNSLNNIYSLISSSEVTGRKYLLSLSDALRYMLYTSEQKFVPLEDELEYLNNYINLESLRLEKDAEIIINIERISGSYEIAPMVLQPLVENAFKHGSQDPRFIELHISVQNGRLIFSCENSIDEYENMNKRGGIGLSNTRRRLELIYPDRHRLEYKIQGNRYLTHLTIKL